MIGAAWQVSSFPVLATGGIAPPTGRDMALDVPGRARRGGRVTLLEHRTGLGHLGGQPQHAPDLARMTLRQLR